MSDIINSNDFVEEVEYNDGLVVIDFFATWCEPCNMLSPIFQDLEEDMEEYAAFYKVDIDESKDFAQRFEVTTVPTVIIFRDGQELDRLVGFIAKNILQEKIEEYV